MNSSQIISLIEIIIEQSLDGQEIENIKIDCKLKWWDLTDPLEISEFLKDTSAIANTFGLDGFLIVGFDDKQKQFNDTYFSDCNLSDTSYIRNLLIKHVEPSFDLNTFDITFKNHKLSVLHIPPSVNKPHVIKTYKRQGKNGIMEESNKIFIRKNTSNYIASKNDIDIMYYDRKNIIPEYNLIVSISAKSLKIRYSINAGAISDFRISPVITFENIGSRPVAIVGITIGIKLFEDSRGDNVFLFEVSISNPLIVPVNNIVNFTWDLNGRKNYNYAQNKFDEVNHNLKHLIVEPIILATNTGKEMIIPVVRY